MNKAVRQLSFLLFIVAGLSNALLAYSLTSDELNNIEVFDKNSASVVFVTNNRLVRNPYTFGYSSQQQGSGTGFIWDEQGHIVTNFHVVDGANQINITLSDQTSWPAKVVGLAPEKDIAVLKIENSNRQLTPVSLGDSDSLSVGRKVLAIGNPFGLDATLTVGVVSALGREIQAPNRRTIRNVIQTDAAINPGNSGGPLLNSDSEVIGVNAAIYSPNGASIGIGFAIPVNTVKRIVPDLIRYGHSIRPVIGIELAPLNWARANNLAGIPILRVFPNGPADKAGLTGITTNSWGATELGDVILSIDDEAVENHDQLLNALEMHKPGDKVTLTILRNGSVRQVKLILAAPQ